MRRVVCNPLLPQAMACATAHHRRHYCASSPSLDDVMAAIRALDAKISAVDAKSSAKIDEKLAAKFSELSAEMKVHKDALKADATYWAIKPQVRSETAFIILLIVFLCIYVLHEETRIESKSVYEHSKSMTQIVTKAMSRNA